METQREYDKDKEHAQRIIRNFCRPQGCLYVTEGGNLMTITKSSFTVIQGVGFYSLGIDFHGYIFKSFQE